MQNCKGKDLKEYAGALDPALVSAEAASMIFGEPWIQSVRAITRALTEGVVATEVARETLRRRLASTPTS